MTPWVQI